MLKKPIPGIVYVGQNKTIPGIAYIEQNLSWHRLCWTKPISSIDYVGQNLS